MRSSSPCGCQGASRYFPFTPRAESGGKSGPALTGFTPVQGWGRGGRGEGPALLKAGMAGLLQAPVSTARRR